MVSTRDERRAIGTTGDLDGTEAEQLAAIIYRLMYQVQERITEEVEEPDAAHWRSEEAKSKLAERDEAREQADEELMR